jgi:hypothetical protein
MSAYISQHNVSVWRHYFQISEETLNKLQFDGQKAVNKKLYFNWRKSWWHGRRLENSPRKSLWRLSLQRGVPVSGAWMLTKLFHIRLYKITLVPEIKAMDFEKTSHVL